MLDILGKILEWIEKYGADTVFMVWFFVLYWRANKRNEKLQDNRLADSKEALGALIEAKHVLELLEKHVEEVEEKIDRNYEEIQKGKND